jgi:sec-independent protein translocase protein TatA
MHLGMGEMLVVLVIALLVFGPSKVPQLGESLGKGIRNFKKAVNDPESADVQVPSPPQRAQLLPASPVFAADAAATTRPTERA